MCKHVLNLRVSLRTSSVVVFGFFSFFLFIFDRGAFFFFINLYDGIVYVVATLLSIIGADLAGAPSHQSTYRLDSLTLIP